MNLKGSINSTNESINPHLVSIREVDTQADIGPNEYEYVVT